MLRSAGPLVSFQPKRADLPIQVGCDAALASPDGPLSYR